MRKLLLMRLMGQRSEIGVLQERCQERRIEKSRGRGVEENRLKTAGSVFSANANGVA
jgi:hypothetical protein